MQFTCFTDASGSNALVVRPRVIGGKNYFIASTGSLQVVLELWGDRRISSRISSSGQHGSKLQFLKE